MSQSDVSPRLVRKGDIVVVREMPEGTEAVVVEVRVVLNLSNGMQQVHRLDEQVTLVTNHDPEDELAIQAAELIARED